MKRAAILLALLLPLTGCGLRPLYGGGSSGPAMSVLSAVSVGPIEGRAGWLVRNAIIDRIGDHGGSGRYRLDIKLDDQIEGYGIRADRTTTRERRTLRARYQLVDTSTNAMLIDTTAGSDVGIDVVNSEYATIAAEQTALERLSETIADQIVTRIALHARRNGAPGSASEQ
ncbi:MAG: LPS assembly lipoprotein LptE [Sphingomonadaceae bacterium]